MLFKNEDHTETRGAGEGMSNKQKHKHHTQLISLPDLAKTNENEKN
jgi:hypothetical protein